MNDIWEDTHTPGSMVYFAYVGSVLCLAGFMDQCPLEYETPLFQIRNYSEIALIFRFNVQNHKSCDKIDSVVKAKNEIPKNDLSRANY